MNRGKRLLSLVLVLLMAFSLCACAGDSDVSGTTVTGTGTPTPAPEDEQELELGVVNGGTYENAYFGFGCSLDAEWSYADEDTLLGMDQSTADLVDDEDTRNKLLNADMFYDMAVTYSDGVTKMNVVVQNINAVYGMLLDEEDIVDASVKQLPEQLAAASMDVQSCEASTIEFAGVQHSCVYIHSLISGIDFYQLQIYVKNGNYISFVTLSSPLEENLDAMLTFFYAV